jgi:recombination protein RecA
VLTTGLKYGVITRSGSSYTFEGQKLGVGFDNVREKLKEDKKLIQDIKKKIIAITENQ